MVEQSNKQRSRFQFRLRTLFIAVTLLAVICAYFSWREKVAKERDAALKLVELVGGLANPDPTDPSRYVIVLPSNINIDERRSIQAAFPDADVWACRTALPWLGSDNGRDSEKQWFRFDDDLK
jgi:hypothetical protein